MTRRSNSTRFLSAFSVSAALGGVAAMMALCAPQSASATVVMAPVFLSVPGEGPTEPLQFQTYNDPADPTLATQTLFSNDTHYIITGFTLHIAGYAEQLSADLLDLVFHDDPNVDAIWGDTAEGNIESDVFSSYSITDNGKTIIFSGGHIGIGDIFTDFLYSAIVGNHTSFTPNNPYSQNIAYIQASFRGYETPLPAAAPLMVAGLGALGAMARRRRAARTRQV